MNYNDYIADRVPAASDLIYIEKHAKFAKEGDKCTARFITSTGRWISSTCIGTFKKNKNAMVGAIARAAMSAGDRIAGWYESHPDAND